MASMKSFLPIIALGMMQDFSKDLCEIKERPNANPKVIKPKKLVRYGTNVKPRNSNIDPKVGRNDPCPCGSGKKYKKCCINRPEPQYCKFEMDIKCTYCEHYGSTFFKGKEKYSGQRISVCKLGHWTGIPMDCEFKPSDVCLNCPNRQIQKQDDIELNSCKQGYFENVITGCAGGYDEATCERCPQMDTEEGSHPADSLRSYDYKICNIGYFNEKHEI